MRCVTQPLTTCRLSSLRPGALLCRVSLGSLLRAAELLHTLVRSHGGSQYDSSGALVPADYWEVQFSALQTAREETALFLHHDAITGHTATRTHPTTHLSCPLATS